MSIWSIDKTPTFTTTPGQSEPKSKNIERLLHIPSKLSDRSLTIRCRLVSYLVYSWWRDSLYAGMLSAYSTAPDHCVNFM